MIATTADTAAIERPDLDKGLGAAGKFGFGAAILATLLYVAYSVYSDAAAAGVHATAFLPFILLAKVPAAATENMRNDMYLASEAIKRLSKEKTLAFSAPEAEGLKTYKASLDSATRFIPTWVKIAVAFALGLGTMIGWKRIVVTVGEKICKSHLTYAQGASAELVAMGTIGAADMLGLPVSTTHVLSSGVAGTMAANRSGLQMSTIRNLLMAWVLTLPVSILLSGVLYALLSAVF